jgi:hypothetical protein
MMTPGGLAEQVAGEIDAICQRYGCEIGVWLTWRDLLHNLEIARTTPGLDVLNFGLQIRIKNGTELSDTNTADNTGESQHAGDG